MKQIKCKSGSKGWQSKLQKIYGDYGTFLGYSELYGIAKRLGYSSPKTAWKYNPLIRGSVIPSDLERVK